MRLKLLMAALAGLFSFEAAAQTAAPVVAPPLDPANVLDLDLSTGGRVRVLLRPDKAPEGVARIKTLVRRGFYDGLTFHRVIDGFMAQGGDPKGDGSGGSELPDLKAEFNELPHLRGVMSLARSPSVDSANSQFFIMLSPNFRLDRNYTAIGRVIEGMQYVDLLAKGEPPAEPSKIVKASMEAEDSAASAPPPAAVPAADATPVAPNDVLTDEVMEAMKQASEKDREPK